MNNGLKLTFGASVVILSVVLAIYGGNKWKAAKNEQKETTMPIVMTVGGVLGFFTGWVILYLSMKKSNASTIDVPKPPRPLFSRQPTISSEFGATANTDSSGSQGF